MSPMDSACQKNLFSPIYMQNSDLNEICCFYISLSLPTWENLFDSDSLGGTNIVPEEDFGHTD